MYNYSNNRTTKPSQKLSFKLKNTFKDSPNILLTPFEHYRFQKMWYVLLFLATITAHHLEIQNLQNNPLILIKERECKIQTGIVKLIHPINLTTIENTIEAITSISYQKLTSTNPLTNLVKFKVQQLYATFYGLKPKKHRSKRWDIIGTAFKFIAGTPDAHDLRLINFTMNELIDQNNEQFKTNMQLNERIAQLTNTINGIVENTHANKAIFNP